MSVKTKGYDIEQVVDVVEMLSYSQGFYGRLLEEILYIEETNLKNMKSSKQSSRNRNFKIL